MNAVTRKEIMRRSLDGEFGEDVKLNNVSRLLPMAEAEVAELEKVIEGNKDWWIAHRKDPDLKGFIDKKMEWKKMVLETRKYLKSKNARAWDELPKFIWCCKCGKALKDDYSCPDGHEVRTVKGEVIWPEKSKKG